MWLVFFCFKMVCVGGGGEGIVDLVITLQRFQNVR